MLEYNKLRNYKKHNLILARLLYPITVKSFTTSPYLIKFKHQRGIVAYDKCIKPLPIHIMLMTHTKDIYYKIHQHASPYFIHAENSRMVPYTDKYDKVGKKRLRQIHTGMNYLAEECSFMDKDTTKFQSTWTMYLLCPETATP